MGPEFITPAFLARRTTRCRLEFVISRFIFIKSGRPIPRTPILSAKTFPASPRSNSKRRTMENTFLATVANGDGGDFAHYLSGPMETGSQLTQFSDQIKARRIGREDALYLLSRPTRRAGKFLRMPLDKLELANATVLVPPSDAVIQSMERPPTPFMSPRSARRTFQMSRLGLDGKRDDCGHVKSLRRQQDAESGRSPSRSRTINGVGGRFHGLY